MVPTSPPSTSTQNASRPPARNRSSSALSTQTLKSQSSTSTGKPRRNKSSASLAGQHHAAHGHGAGHHTVSFQHHRKASHGPHGLKRVGSASGASRKPTFGLGMTTMGDSEHVETGQHEATAPAQQPRRPSMSKRRTSSSSTVTAVSRPSHERRTSGAGGRRSRSNSTAALPTEAEPARETGDRADQAKTGQRAGSVSSSSGDWESATDSPIRFAQKLPDTSEENPPPEDQSALTKALDAHDDPADAQPSKPQQQQVPARGPGRKAKFQLGASDPFEDDDDEEEEEDSNAPPRDQKVAHQAGTEPAIPPETQAGQVDAHSLDDDVVPEAEEGSIPAAAMPPAATAAVPSLPATIRAVAPPTPEGGQAELDPNDEQEAAGVAAPPPTSAPQHLSPPEIPPDDQVDRSKSGASLLAAAQPELAFPNKPPSNPPSQGPTRATSPYPEPATPPAGPTKPLSPNPTSVQRDREEREGEQSPSKKREPEQKQQRGDKPSSSPSKGSMPPRLKPVRKASDASIISTMSRRSYFDRPAPQFRRSASGVAPPSVDRDVTARGDFSAAINEESHTSEGRSHARGESMNSMRSLRQATEPATAPQARRADSLAPGDAQRPRSAENAGGALAALGSIAAAAGRPSPSPVEPALSHAKRSASGYFNALRGFTSIPAPSSTPPLSPLTSQSPRYPIPGPSSSSYTRSSSTRPRPSPSPRQPPLVVKFVDSPQPSSAAPPERPASVQRASSPAALRGNLSAQHRNASSASLGPMSRTQQKALLARDAPQYAGGEAAGGALVPPATPGGLTPAQQQFLALQQQRAAATAAAAATGPATGAGGTGNSSSGSGPPSSAASPAPPGAQAVNQGMQKWAFGLVREAERIERQYRAVEKWRDPLGESLERVLIVRQRARRRREDDREKVKQAIAAAAAAKQQQQLQPGGAGKSRTSTPEAGMSRRSSAGGTSEGDSRPASTRGKLRGMVA